MNFENLFKRDSEASIWFKAICHQDEVIGSVTLDKTTIFEGQEVLELGNVIAKKYWGKGYATKAVQETLRVGPILSGIKTGVAFVKSHKYCF